jgi:histone H3/H4
MENMENIEKVEENENVEESENVDENVENVENVEEKKKRRKKHNHYFEHHLRKILKDISTDRDITQNAKTQLNELGILICTILSKKINTILTSNRKKTVNDHDVASATRLIFGNIIGNECVQYGTKTLQLYEENNKRETLKGQSRHSKAELSIPPSIMEHFLRNAGEMHISNQAPIFLASVMECFFMRILKASCLSSLEKGVRLTIRDLQNGIEKDPNLAMIFKQNKILFFQSGTIPYIHPHIRGLGGRNDKKSIKLMSKIQEENGYIFPKSVIEGRLKAIIGEFHPDIRYQKDCFVYFQDYLEKWLVDVLKLSNELTLFNKKTRVTEDEIGMVLTIGKSL